MTWRTKLADWISGGELTRARVANVYWQRTAAMNFSCHVAASRNVNLLHRIAAMETPKANATVRRMAAIAREAVK